MTILSLRTGDLVTVPAPYRIPGCKDRVTVVAEYVDPDGAWFTDTNGTRHWVADAEAASPGAPVPAKAA